MKEIAENPEDVYQSALEKKHEIHIRIQKLNVQSRNARDALDRLTQHKARPIISGPFPRLTKSIDWQKVVIKNLNAALSKEHIALAQINQRLKETEVILSKQKIVNESLHFISQ